MQGASNAALYTTTYSIFSMQYGGSDFMKVNSLFKGTIGKIEKIRDFIYRFYLGGGLLLGLCFGTLLYIFGGYFLPFVVYSSIMIL